MYMHFGASSTNVLAMTGSQFVRMWWSPVVAVDSQSTLGRDSLGW